MTRFPARASMLARYPAEREALMPTPHKLAPDLKRLRAALLKFRRENPNSIEWPLPRKGAGHLTRSCANKYLLMCTVNFQSKVDLVFRRIDRCLAALEHPRDLWHAIAAHAPREWRARPPLHRFPRFHDRVHRIAKQVVRDFQGDARRIWASGDLATTMKNISDIHLGPALEGVMDLRRQAERA